MAQNKKDWIPDYKRQVWIGNFHRFKNPGDSKPTRRDLCTFNDATYNSKGNVRSEKALNSYLRSLHEHKEAELLQKLNYESPEKIDKKVILLQDAINEFKKYNLPKYSPDWQRHLKSHLKFWIKKLGNIEIEKITKKKAIKIRNSIKTSNSTKNRYFAALSSLLTACVDDHEFDSGESWLSFNPLHKLKKEDKLEESKNIGIALTLIQLKDLLKESKNIFEIDDNHKDDTKEFIKSKNLDFYLLILMALYTGARKSELTKLKWSDYDGSKVVFRKTKNKQERVCPIFGEVKSILDDQEYTKNKIFMYKDYRKPWNKVRIKANLGNFRFHDLRHSTVSYLLENKVPHLTVAEIVGHNSYEMIKRYNQINPQHLFDSLKTLEKQLKVR